MALLTFRQAPDDSAYNATFKFTAFTSGNSATSTIRFFPIPGFSPASIAGLELWLDANDSSTITKDGSNRVSSWADKSGQGFSSFTQSTDANKPVWTDAAVNSKPSLLFDNAANQYLLAAEAVVAGYPFTVFVVAESDDEAVVGTTWWCGNQSASEHSFYIRGNGAAITLLAIAAGVGSSANTTSGFTADVPALVRAVGASATSRAILLDGGSQGTDTSNLTPVGMTHTAVGMSRDTSPAGPFSGYICEILVYSAVLSAEDITSVEDYLAEKWETP